MKRMKSRPLDELLDDIVFHDDWEGARGAGNLNWPEGWYAISAPHGIIAYFEDETDAWRFRLDYINRIMNP